MVVRAAFCHSTRLVIRLRDRGIATINRLHERNPVVMGFMDEATGLSCMNDPVLLNPAAIAVASVIAVSVSVWSNGITFKAMVFNIIVTNKIVDVRD